jgi:hypothetical protein
VLSGNVNALAETADGSVWVGGNMGLYVVPPGGAGPAGGAVARRARRPGQDVVLGCWWTASRCCGWTPTPGCTACWAAAARGAVQAVAESDSAGGGSVGANLLDDAQGRIWTHQNVFDPRDGSRYELSPADGADIGTGWFRSYTGLADGRMLFGGSTGMLVVQPDQVQAWVYAPPLVVSELRLAGERVPVATPLELTPRSAASASSLPRSTSAARTACATATACRALTPEWIDTGADFVLPATATCRRAVTCWTCRAATARASGARRP